MANWHEVWLGQLGNTQFQRETIQNTLWNEVGALVLSDGTTVSAKLGADWSQVFNGLILQVWAAEDEIKRIVG